MNKKKYNLIVSLGEDCACSMYLRQHYLQVQSYPFDWLANASFEESSKLIINNFSDFLNINDLRLLPEIDNDSDYDFYENTRNRFYYYYDFKKDSNLKDVINEVKEKYNRRIGRLNQQITESDKILFVWLSHFENTDNDLIVRYVDKICEKFNKQIDFLIIENDISKTGDEIQVTHIAPNIIKYNLDTASYEESGNKILGNIKNCNKIFKQYELIESWDTKLERKLRRFFIKILCVFIPANSVKVKFKSYIR